MRVVSIIRTELRKLPARRSRYGNAGPLGSKSFFFQPASRVTQEESHHQKDGFKG